jgi:hypothetical protein
MTELYAANIVEGVVRQVTVGTAQWCIDRLGGQWVDTPTLVGIGWTWNEVDGFQPPPEPEEP